METKHEKHSNTNDTHTKHNKTTEAHMIKTTKPNNNATQHTIIIKQGTRKRTHIKNKTKTMNNILIIHIHMINNTNNTTQ